jgi:hypothetical protein
MEYINRILCEGITLNFFVKTVNIYNNKQLKKLMTKLRHEFHIFDLYIVDKLFEKIQVFLPIQKHEQTCMTRS